jgi:hypothetical protein
MTTLLTIDPGKHVSGWAFFEGVTLVACGISPEGLPGYDGAARRCVVEKMRWRPTAESQPNDLIDCQISGLLFAHSVCHCPIELLPASSWKTALPKAVHHRRIDKALTGGEQAKTVWWQTSPHLKEVYDAIGIGLFVLGRTTKAGVTRA